MPINISPKDPKLGNRVLSTDSQPSKPKIKWAVLTLLMWSKAMRVLYTCPGALPMCVPRPLCEVGPVTLALWMTVETEICSSVEWQSFTPTAGLQS